MTDVARRHHDPAGSMLEEALCTIRQKASQVRFGTITLTLHEGRPTQVEVSEKTRFQP
jgi:hypothetical protein